MTDRDALVERLRGHDPEIERLRAALRRVQDLHQPDWASERAKAEGKEPWVCILCSVADGSWPCSTRETVDDALGETPA